MTLSCPNCNQTVLHTDTICWHCGHQLPQQPAKPPTQSESQTAVSSPEPFSLSAVFVYSAVTAVVIIGLWLSLRILEQRPLVLLHPDTNINTGWLPVTDRSLRFTLDIPPTWHSLARQNPQQQAEFEALVAGDDHFTTAVAPLNTAISDMELLFIILSENPEQATAVPAFVVVAWSEELGRLSLDDIAALVQQVSADIEIRQIDLFRSFMGDRRLTLLLKMPATKGDFNCQQHVAQGERASYLIAGCAPETRYGVYRETIEKILFSFQPLP